MARGSRGSTSRPRIVSAALDLIDREGLEGLTMRSLAAELGVVPMATYRHFANKGELLDALLEQVSSQVDPGSADAGWRATATRLATDIRAELLLHPGVAAALVNRPSLGPSAIALSEVMYAAFLHDGFERDEVVAAANLVFTYVLGFVALEAPRRSATGSVEQALHVTQAELGRVYEGLDPVALPVTMDLMPDPAEFVSDAQFRFGLETVLDGLARRRDGRRRG